jgi:sugar phosphate isomerase/epimerase
MRRREALRLIGLLALSRAALSHGSAHRLNSIGLQLYTVRDALEHDFDATLGRVAAIGYRQVEFAGYFGHSVKQLRASLRQAGLIAPSAHVPLDAIGAGWANVIENALAIGHRYLVVASPGEVADLDGYRRIAARFNEAGEQAAKAGILFAYHNHDSDFRAIDGKLPYDLLLEATDPKFVRFEMDIYWLTRGGQKPLTYFERWPGRFALLHAKDAAGAPPYRMADVGTGIIDWRDIFVHANEAGVKHVFVERDDAPDPLASAAASFAYLHDLRF